MNLKSHCFFWVFMCCTHLVLGQRFLVLETKGKVKTRKFSVGTPIRIHLKEDKKYLWHKHVIQELDEANKCIWVSDFYCIPLKDIDGFDLTPGKGNAMAQAAAKFALPYALFSSVQMIRGTPLNNFQFGLGASGILAWIASKLFLSGQKKINAKNRLKIIDLTIYRPRA